MKKYGLIICVLLLCIIAVTTVNAWYIYNEFNIEKEIKDKIEQENIITNDEEENEYPLASGDETDEIKTYLNSILDQCQKIAEFDDINEADKTWLYAPLNRYIVRDEGDYYVTEEEIKNALIELYGNDLKIDIRKDTDNADDFVVPKFDEETGEYMFSATGFEVYDQYAVDTIEKIDDLTYRVTVVEYTVNLFGGPDENPTSKTIVGLRQDDGSIKEVFEVNPNENIELKYYVQNDEIIEDVLENKDNFNSYSITIERNENGLLNVKSIMKIEK